MTPTKNNNNTYTNGWAEWSKHVLLELERLNNHITNLEDKIDTMRTDIDKRIVQVDLELATLKTRFSMIGVIIGGSFVIIIEVGMWIIDKFG